MYFLAKQPLPTFLYKKNFLLFIPIPLHLNGDIHKTKVNTMKTHLRALAVLSLTITQGPTFSMIPKPTASEASSSATIRRFHEITVTCRSCQVKHKISVPNGTNGSDSDLLCSDCWFSKHSVIDIDPEKLLASLPLGSESACPTPD